MSKYFYITKFWYMGLQWPPQLCAGREYYDGWHYYLHLGPIFLCKSVLPRRFGLNHSPLDYPELEKGVLRKE